MENNRAHADAEVLRQRLGPTAQRSPTGQRLAIQPALGRGRTLHGSVLRRFLDSYLPQRFACATGFVSDGDDVSNQCDLIIYDCLECPLLFRSNEFVIVDRSAVRAVVQIKGTMAKRELLEAVANIRSVKDMDNSILGAVFSYAGAAKTRATLEQWFRPLLQEPQALPDYLHFGGGVQLQYVRQTEKLC